MNALCKVDLHIMANYNIFKKYCQKGGKKLLEQLFKNNIFKKYCRTGGKKLFEEKNMLEKYCQKEGEKVNKISKHPRMKIRQIP